MEDDKEINWAEIEAGLGNGNSPTSEHHDVQVMRARVVESNFRKAEALSLIAPTALLQELRTLLARGHLTDVNQKIDEELRLRPALRQDPEWKLELSRLYAYGGRWQDCVRESTELLALSPLAPTRMTALQVRSIAHYEAGNWVQALRDIESIRSLASLYPDAQTVFYAEILSIKILGFNGDATQAREKLHRLWCKETDKAAFSADTLLTFLRTEGHLAFCEGAFQANLHGAALLLCNAIGDEQYAALARLELSRGDAAIDLSTDRLNFPKVDMLFRELAGVDRSTTAKVLGRRLKHQGSRFPLHRQFQGLVFPERRALARLGPFTFFLEEKPTRLFTALVEIAREGTISKEALFERMYRQKYAAHLHDPLLHQLFSRIRKKWLVELKVEKAGISLPGWLVVEI